MIYGFIHPGSGLGNQLHRYIAIRVLAKDKGYEFSMIDRQYFKGKSFMNLDFGVEDYIAHHIEEGTGRIIPHTSLPVWQEKTNQYYDPEINFVEDSTIIDGEFQDTRYFEHRIGWVDEWLKVEPLDIPDDLCIIGFRGGEFAIFPELFLPMTYWMEAVEMMKEINPNMRFQVVTDDPELAKKLFPFKITHEIGSDWRSVRYAKHAIVANSSFFILPRLLRHESDDIVVTIAPRYWARRNIKEWSTPQNYYKRFTYI